MPRDTRRVADQQHGTVERRLPPHPVGRRRSYTARSCSCLFEAGGQFLVAGLYPDGYIS